MPKRYYWLKINEYFFEDEKVQWLESQENGHSYVYFYIKLLLKCLKNKDNGEYGFLRFTEKMPYDDKLLARITNTDIDTVRVAMKYFQELEMLEILEDKTIYIEAVNKMIGSESDSAQRVRIHREKIKMLQCNDDVTEKKPNKDIDIYKDKDTYNTIRFKKPTINEIDNYKKQRQQNKIINFTSNQFYDYYESKGWMVGKNKMKDWKAAFRTWEQKDYNSKQKEKTITDIYGEVENVT